MKTKPKTKTRKQTSDRVSRLAAQVRERFAGLSASATLLVASEGAIVDYKDRRGLTVRELRSLANSCVGQDEVRGPRAPKKRKRAKGKH